MAGEDSFWMGEALLEAHEAYSKGEVPIGCVIVKDGKIIGRGHNLKETLGDPTAHAEMMAIRELAESLKGWRILGSSMYSTLEPCPMCAGAIVHSRIQRLVIGTKDPKTGACGSLINLVNDQRFNHNVEVEFGVREEECQSLLAEFFKNLRA